MKKLLIIGGAVALAFSIAIAATTNVTFGSKSSVTTLHATTNYFVAVLGSATNSPVVKVSPVAAVGILGENGVITNGQTTSTTLAGGVASGSYVTASNVTASDTITGRILEISDQATVGLLSTPGIVQANNYVLPAGAFRGTNQIYRTNLTGNLSVTLSSLSEGVLYTLMVSNPATYTVTFANFNPQFWVDYQDGTSPTATTNGVTVYTFLRTGTITNGWATAKTIPIAPGANITFTTNANSITVAASSQITPLLIANVASQSTLSNVMFLRASSNIIHATTAVVAPHSSGNTNTVVDFNMKAITMTLTNNLRFIHSTNRLAGEYLTSSYLIFAGPTNRWLFFNANWIGLGTTNNPQASAIFLETNKMIRIDFEHWGASETNVVAYANKQQFP